MERDIHVTDLMGHGASPSPKYEAAPEAYTLEHQSARLQEEAVRLGIRRMHLAGYSMGGRTALLYALEHPDQVTSLTLLSASPGIEDDKARAERAANDAVLADRIVEEGLEKFVTDWTGNEVISGGVDDTALREGRRDRLAQRADGLRGSLLGMGQGVQPNLWGRLSELRMPVLLIAGERDEKYSALMTEMAERIPEARLIIIPNAGHDIVSAVPESLAETLRRFWDEFDAVID
jgi:2-succinyl-6-hydroxy-2,4-cyclohexadiene-1-carboxylate synthase